MFRFFLSGNQVIKGFGVFWIEQGNGARRKKMRNRKSASGEGGRLKSEQE